MLPIFGHWQATVGIGGRGVGRHFTVLTGQVHAVVELEPTYLVAQAQHANERVARNAELDPGRPVPMAVPRFDQPLAGACVHEQRRSLGCAGTHALDLLKNLRLSQYALIGGLGGLVAGQPALFQDLRRFGREMVGHNAMDLLPHFGSRLRRVGGFEGAFELLHELFEFFVC